MAKADKVEKKDQKSEKSVTKVKKSSYSKKKKVKKNIVNGIAYVQSTFFSTFFLSAILNYFFNGVNFLPAIAIALPFLVLALHLVLCPLTGNFFLCRKPL